MNHKLYDLLHEWLKSGTEVQKSHAEFRLSQPDAQDLEYPSLFQQAMNLAGAVGDVVAGAIRGEPVAVSEEEQDRRLAICHACLPPEGYWDAAAGRCSKCGCFGAWKTWLATQKCPIDKW